MPTSAESTNREHSNQFEHLGGLSGAGLASGRLAVSPATMKFSGVTVDGSENQIGCEPMALHGVGTTACA